MPTERIAAVSHYSRDPLVSSIAPLAAKLPITYETAEKIVALRPDLVLTSRHSAIPTRNALKRVGIRFECSSVVLVEESLTQISRIAAWSATLKRAKRWSPGSSPRSTPLACLRTRRR